MITLYQFKPYWDLPNASPFCMKVETYLKLAGLSYQVEVIQDPRKAPKGKLPFIKDGDKTIPDSGFIIDYLKQKEGDVLDQHLSPEEKAKALMIQRMLEEHLYWILVYARWIDEDNWKILKPLFFGHLPAIIQLFLPTMIRKDLQKKLSAQGIGRHSPEEIYTLGKNDLGALSQCLGDKLYFMGTNVTSIDACAYAFLMNILHTPLESPLKIYTKTCTNLVAYCNRIQEKLSH
jgi:glutathione S-transferase